MVKSGKLRRAEFMVGIVSSPVVFTAERNGLAIACFLTQSPRTEMCCFDVF